MGPVQKNQFNPHFCGVQLTEGWVEPIERLIRQLSDSLQRMGGRDPPIERHLEELEAAAFTLTYNLGWSAGPFSSRFDFRQTKLSRGSSGNCQLSGLTQKRFEHLLTGSDVAHVIINAILHFGLHFCAKSCTAVPV